MPPFVFFKEKLRFSIEKSGKLKYNGGNDFLFAAFA